MKNIAGKPCFSVKDLVDFSGFSRSYIGTLIAKTKEGKLSPPLPFYDFVTSNVKSIVGNGGFTTKWEKILSQFIINQLSTMNEEINLLRNFAQSVNQRLEKAERSAREQNNHHYYKIFADGVKQLLEAL